MQGRTLVKLNIGNPGAFGFRAPDTLQHAIADRIARTGPYTHQQGLPEAREAIAAFHARRGTPDARKLSRAFIGLALARAEADAQAQANAGRVTKRPDTGATNGNEPDGVA